MNESNSQENPRFSRDTNHSAVGCSVATLLWLYYALRLKRVQLFQSKINYPNDFWSLVDLSLIILTIVALLEFQFGKDDVNVVLAPVERTAVGLGYRITGTCLK